MKNIILIKNNFVEIPSGKSKTSLQLVGTVVSNLSYYGFILSKDALNRLTKLSESQIKTWWKSVEPSLKEVTGDSKNISKFVVYKNFPQEVLDMSEAQYWINQILMYWGMPNDLFTEDEKPRPSILEKIELKVLHLANDKTLSKIADNLLQSSARWTPEQFSFVEYLTSEENIQPNIAKIPFKENMVRIAKFMLNAGTLKLKSATDILRLAVAVSEGDVTFKTNTRFMSFNRDTRKKFLNLLENSSNLEEDSARDPERWKRFLHALHAFDYQKQFPKVCKIADKVYNDQVKSFNGKIEVLLSMKDKKALKILENRAGDFVRKFNRLVKIYRSPAVLASFKKVAPKLTVSQLLKFDGYIKTVNKRNQRTIAPRGNWGKLQILDNTASIPAATVKSVREIIAKTLKNKVKDAGILKVNLDDRTTFVKLQGNDADLTPYGRGTVFPIPDNIKFIRTASYWQKKTHGSNWFDNGWNFFDENWKAMGACCWNTAHFKGKGSNSLHYWSDFGKLNTSTRSNDQYSAIYAGDPTNSKDMQGKAAELIDLYLDKLSEQGVRYAVWNVLCYSRIKFKDADDVFAGLLWGEESQTGKLFEPSRCQLAFQLNGDYFTKFVAYIDLKERKLVYMDANFKANPSSAVYANDMLEKTMPAYVEYLNSLPSVHDLFVNQPKSKKGTPVLYNDEGVKINGGQAYVFKPVNADNKFEPLSVPKILIQ